MRIPYYKLLPIALMVLTACGSAPASDRVEGLLLKFAAQPTQLDELTKAVTELPQHIAFRG